MEQHAEILVDDPHQPLDPRGLECTAGHSLEEAQGALLLEERQVVPTPEVAVDPGRHGSLGAELVDLVARA